MTVREDVLYFFEAALLCLGEYEEDMDHGREVEHAEYQVGLPCDARKTRGHKPREDKAGGPIDLEYALSDICERKGRDRCSQPMYVYINERVVVSSEHDACRKLYPTYRGDRDGFPSDFHGTYLGRIFPRHGAHGSSEAARKGLKNLWRDRRKGNTYLQTSK